MQAVPSSKGRLEVLIVDLSDLTTIRPAVDEFLRKEERLDVLTNVSIATSDPRCDGG